MSGNVDTSRTIESVVGSKLNRVNETTMLRERDIAWLAGVIDGEGCFLMNRSYNCKTSIIAYIAIQMTHRETMDRVAEMFSELAGREIKVRTGKRQPKHRNIYGVRAEARRDVLAICRALEPHLLTKWFECTLMRAYLERAARTAHYHPQPIDYTIMEAVRSLKHDCGEAQLREFFELLRQVIPSQAVAAATTPTEGVETRGVSANDNRLHERPALVH